MSSNPPPPTTSTPPPPPPPPPPTTATTSQSGSEIQISHETPPRTPPIPLSQSDSKAHLPKGWTDQETKDELFEKAMQEDWDAVISIYKDKKDIVSTAKITRNKETALHIAISDSKTEVVKQLLDIIDSIKIREMTNDMDENPLHLAASLGQAEMCKQLVEKDPELIGARNKEGETDGNSILHVAIQREYFGDYKPTHISPLPSALVPGFPRKAGDSPLWIGSTL
ncbi:ankyrin repeat and SAM domain-containing protein 1A-like protein [Cinnamomum micranthum f. kanehirae]|uniref:Ankyrin repeat and SAM domain-containing protein 1A-like protein n=1 Tax=Cinnamomum micranthum f. kanehirae TaxID=337451 RepID=A0A443NAU6_9MAGN|nr:ankyrin repeat and SAM domain-containing protein 1A-like protein [Cinnamomum micranthum f. kanehirae]